MLIVGNPGLEHVGSHLAAAAKVCGLDFRLIDLREAWRASALRRRVSFHLLGKRPPGLARFSASVVESCRQIRPDLVLTTGIAPVSTEALEEIGRLGARRACYLTDDPWNPANGARFFFRALARYDVVFSTRRANLAQLERHGCPAVEYLPFAYNPELHFVEHASSTEEPARYACELAFIGGADQDRVTAVRALLDAGIDLKLYGGYWDRFPETGRLHRGFVLGRELRLAVSGGQIHLCMGRAANRDGHAMRSFELPAMGACLVVEDTPEHREIFGDDGEAVRYYKDLGNLIRAVRELREAPEERARMAEAARMRVTNGQHTYRDRLRAVLDYEYGDRGMRVRRGIL